MYYIPYFGILVGVICAQGVIFYFLSVYLVKILNQKNYVGLPWNFLFDPAYYKAKRYMNDYSTESVYINNICKSYKNVVCKKSST